MDDEMELREQYVEKMVSQFEKELEDAAVMGGRDADGERAFWLMGQAFGWDALEEPSMAPLDSFKQQAFNLIAMLVEEGLASRRSPVDRLADLYEELKGDDATS